MKLSNTWKHFRIGCIAGILVLFLLQFVSVDIRACLGWSLIGFWLCVTIGWEIVRYLKAQKKRFKQYVIDRELYANNDSAQDIHGSRNKAREAYAAAYLSSLKINWPDTIADLLAGNVPVWLLCIIGMYGQSVVGAI